MSRSRFRYPTSLMHTRASTASSSTNSPAIGTQPATGDAPAPQLWQGSISWSVDARSSNISGEAASRSSSLSDHPTILISSCRALASTEAREHSRSGTSTHLHPSNVSPSSLVSFISSSATLLVSSSPSFVSTTTISDASVIMSRSSPTHSSSVAQTSTHTSASPQTLPYLEKSSLLRSRTTQSNLLWYRKYEQAWYATSRARPGEPPRWMRPPPSIKALLMSLMSRSSRTMSPGWTLSFSAAWAGRCLVFGCTSLLSTGSAPLFSFHTGESPRLGKIPKFFPSSPSHPRKSCTSSKAPSSLTISLVDLFLTWHICITLTRTAQKAAAFCTPFLNHTTVVTCFPEALYRKSAVLQAPKSWQTTMMAGHPLCSTSSRGPNSPLECLQLGTHPRPLAESTSECDLLSFRPRLADANSFSLVSKMGLHSHQSLCFFSRRLPISCTSTECFLMCSM
mmetsp:Transcript_20300/g.49062  ORF Transcript_20300/g.49062 Transcript_20300/m.49062 type:complete len:452 (-) Transcript_20300:1543-2898(-)